MADQQKHFMNKQHGAHMQGKPAIPQADGDPNQDDQPADGIPCPHCGAMLTIKPHGELAEVDDQAPAAGGGDDQGSYGLG